MPAKIRLARHGRKRSAFYHIIIADSRAPRDGKYIERIGSYNPNTNPATIDLNFDSALEWLQKGAQPTDTARAILSYKGVMYMNHLLKGVAKGALNEEQAKEKFEAWNKEKEGKIQAKVDKLSDAKNTEIKSRLDAESKVNEKRVEAIAKKKSDIVAEEEAANKEAEVEEVTEVKEKVVEAKEVVTEVKEEVAEVKEEVAEVKEEVVEVKEVVTEVKEEVAEVKEKVVEAKKEVTEVKEADKKEEVTEVKEKTAEVKKEGDKKEETKK